MTNGRWNFFATLARNGREGQSRPVLYVCDGFKIDGRAKAVPGLRAWESGGEPDLGGVQAVQGHAVRCVGAGWSVCAGRSAARWTTPHCFSGAVFRIRYRGKGGDRFDRSRVRLAKRSLYSGAVAGL